MTAPRLEVAYRRLLRAYPRRWRQENGDEVVATLLDMADAAGRTRPSPGDIADLIAHGLAARLNVSLGLVPAQVRHRLAAMALASAAMLSLALFLVAEVLPEPYPALPAHPSVPNLAFGPFVTLGAVVYPFPVLAFVAAAAGYRRLTRTLLGLTGVALCVAVLAASRGVAERPQMYLLVVLGLLVVMAAGGLPTAVRRRDLFGAAAVFGLFLTVATAASIWLHRRTYWSDSPFATRWNRPLVAYRGSTGLLDTIEMATPAAVVLGILIAAVVSRRHPGWVIATFAVGGTWLLMPIAHSLRYSRWGWEDNYAGFGFVLAGGLVTLAALVDLFHAAGLRIVRISDPPARALDTPNPPFDGLDDTDSE